MPIINQVVAGGGTTPTGTIQITTNGTHDVTNYATADVNVPTTAQAHYVGLTIDNGAIKKSGTGSLDFSTATSVSNYGMYYAYAYSDVSGNVDLSNVTQIGDYGLQDAFFHTEVTYVNMSSFTGKCGNYGMQYAFRNSALTGFNLSNMTDLTQAIGISLLDYAFGNITTLVGAFSFPKLEKLKGCGHTFDSDTKITFFGMPKLKQIGTSNSGSQMQYMFNECSGLLGVNMNAVETILGTSQQMQYCFRNSGLLKIRFPMLTTIHASSFSTNAFSTTALTEIHFRKDMQATIEAMTGYSTQWGATNATVYFDLVGTLTGADGNTYTRDEYNSVYSDQHGQFQTAVAWKYNDTTYYTPAGAEPTVSDAIYSDAACTQSVTTITAIA